MRLTTIKLSGFKSFVDPTVLHLPTNMTGIVGPNGCGKSNIIDAIRWVMGESAPTPPARRFAERRDLLRIDRRKPVGNATVELIFDNSDGTVIGEYASYNEISVKRAASRDGQSHYFLNGSRCRRRDITDLFLGTGLGARSYSIIEQGMISEIISAHPDELRGYLEEAAGISKYKERRKETESRIRATRENLERLNDVREEVEKQLEHLNRQAKAAARWQDLKTRTDASRSRIARAALPRHRGRIGRTQRRAAARRNRHRSAGRRTAAGRNADRRPSRKASACRREPQQGAGRGLSRRRRDCACRATDSAQSRTARTPRTQSRRNGKSAVGARRTHSRGSRTNRIAARDAERRRTETRVAATECNDDGRCITRCRSRDRRLADAMGCLREIVLRSGAGSRSGTHASGLARQTGAGKRPSSGIAAGRKTRDECADAERSVDATRVGTRHA